MAAMLELDRDRPMQQDRIPTLVPGPESERDYRDALGRFATGVTLVTALGSDGPVGMTVNSFASVSLDPALVLWSLSKSSGRYAPFSQAERYAIHVLSASQRSLALAFARNGDAFDHCNWQSDRDGVPLVEGCLARFDCTRQALHDAGDHVIVVGNVDRFVSAQGEPLLFVDGHFENVG